MTVVALGAADSSWQNLEYPDVSNVSTSTYLCGRDRWLDRCPGEGLLRPAGRREAEALQGPRRLRRRCRQGPRLRHQSQWQADSPGLRPRSEPTVHRTDARALELRRDPRQGRPDEWYHLA